MVDINKLRLKFPGKNPNRAKSRAAIKAIAREFERKRIELGVSTPGPRRGVPYYATVILGLMLVGALVVPQLLNRDESVFDSAAKNQEKAERAVSVLAQALGRFRFHTGTYPTTEQGLAILAYKLDRPELQRVPVPGWNGPYINKLLPDPWGNAYVYLNDSPTQPPTILSMGPDGAAGTPDDIIADPAVYDEAFRDRKWTEGWMPQYLRGYVVVQNAAHRRQIEADVERIMRGGPDPAVRVRPETLSVEVLSLTNGAARIKASYDTASGHVERELEVGNAIPWTPERPFLQPVELGEEVFAVPLRTLSGDAEGGFRLNGEPFELKGVSLADVRGPLAALMREEDGFSRILGVLRDIGANAVGGIEFTPMQQELCDRNGFLAWGGDAGFEPLRPWLVDAAGFPTEDASRLRALWNRRDTVRLVPHWNWRDGDVIDVRCITNGDAAELFVNGESAGRLSGTNFVWSVPFDLGSIKAIAYRNGSYIGEAEVETAGPAAKLRLSSEVSVLALGESICVTVEAVDDSGRRVPIARDKVTLSVAGPGEITSAFNADGFRAACPAKELEIPLYEGRAVAVVRRGTDSGAAIDLWAKAKGLASERLIIDLAPAEGR